MAEQKSQRGANLTQADRERGGRVSAAKQVRDARGKFAGAKDRKRSQQQESDQAKEKEDQHPKGGPSGHHAPPPAAHHGSDRS